MFWGLGLPCAFIGAERGLYMLLVGIFNMLWVCRRTCSMLKIGVERYIVPFSDSLFAQGNLLSSFFSFLVYNLLICQ